MTKKNKKVKTPEITSETTVILSEVEAPNPSETAPEKEENTDPKPAPVNLSFKVVNSSDYDLACTLLGKQFYSLVNYGNPQNLSIQAAGDREYSDFLLNPSSFKVKEIAFAVHGNWDTFVNGSVFVGENKSGTDRVVFDLQPVRGKISENTVTFAVDHTFEPDSFVQFFCPAKAEISVYLSGEAGTKIEPVSHAEFAKGVAETITPVVETKTEDTDIPAKEKPVEKVILKEAVVETKKVTSAEVNSMDSGFAKQGLSKHIPGAEPSSFSLEKFGKEIERSMVAYSSGTSLPPMNEREIFAFVKKSMPGISVQVEYYDTAKEDNGRGDVSPKLSRRAKIILAAFNTSYKFPSEEGEYINVGMDFAQPW